MKKAILLLIVLIVGYLFVVNIADILWTISTPIVNLMEKAER